MQSPRNNRRRPGEIRDAILAVMNASGTSVSLAQIQQGVRELVGPIAESSVRSYLRLNSESLFRRDERGTYSVRQIEPKPELPSAATEFKTHRHGRSILVQADCFDWMAKQPANSVHAVVTDPPYGLVEYAPDQQEKLRAGKGGVWRIPPSFDGSKRAPLPRFTVLSADDLLEP